ncbi:MAG: cyclodeaminase/cyclohydrolase family protein, partial [bacterium]|nr:cyclodeaminase/cyclohydrolase family protein [bacterium]
MAMRVTASHRDGSEKDELEAKALQMDKIYSDILAFAKKDGEAYGFVVDAIRLPKGTEAEIAVRREALQAALKKAALVPMEAAELCLAAIKAGASFLPNCAKPSRSDVAAGTMLLYAGVRGCLLNILQNCKNLADRGDILERAAEIRIAAEELHVTILKDTEITL